MQQLNQNEIDSVSGAGSLFNSTFFKPIQLPSVQLPKLFGFNNLLGILPDLPERFKHPNLLPDLFKK